MEYEYKTKGVCSRKIIVELEDNIIKKVNIVGGCPGNSEGIANLIIGMDVDKVIERLRGVCCGSKSTSCPDQLTYALEEAKNVMENK